MKGFWAIVQRVFRFIYQRYLLQAMGAMAQGLFASLIIGLIISQLAKIPYLDFLAPMVGPLSSASPVVGAAIGVAVAFGLKSVPLAIFASAGAGAYGYAVGGPVGAYLAAIASAECGRLVAGHTPVDIVLIPLVSLVAGGVVTRIVGAPISAVMTGLGTVINSATELMPIPMGIIVASLMGLALTAPISSAAIAISLGLSGLAAGAATAGCCAHMVAFAVASFSVNGVGGLVSQGLGTSMLQVENILKKPAILLPAVVCAAIGGPLATTLLPLTNNPAGAGMGTSGLVGPINAWITMSADPSPVWALIKIGLICFVIPAVLALATHLFYLKLGWYKKDDMRLNLQK